MADENKTRWGNFQRKQNKTKGRKQVGYLKLGVGKTSVRLG